MGSKKSSYLYLSIYIISFILINLISMNWFFRFDFTDNKKCNLILTTGGTGPTTRDVTPEATHAVCERIFDGFAEQMRNVSLRTVPTAILSRQTAGTRGKSLIINLPGKPDAIAVWLGAVFFAVPKCLELLDSSNIQIDLDFVEQDFS